MKPNHVLLEVVENITAWVKQESAATTPGNKEL
jgi:hypothetical protein